jgi:L-ascorbate metabolism protein UlaG (beta-lactamase superfamily)
MLLDPGSFSKGFEELEGLTAVCFTHQHVDHLDRERLRGLLDRNPGVRVISDEGSAEALGEAGAEAEVVHDGDELEIAGVGVRVVGRDHAVIHPDVPSSCSEPGYAMFRIGIVRVHRSPPPGCCESRTDAAQVRRRRL